MIGPMVTKTLMAQNRLAEPPNVRNSQSPPPHPGWQVRPPSDFINDPMKVRQAVYDFKARAAIIVNSNATTLLKEAVATGNASYDPLRVAQIVYVEARDETTVDTYVVRPLYQFQIEFGTMFGQQVWQAFRAQELRAEGYTVGVDGFGECIKRPGRSF